MIGDIFEEMERMQEEMDSMFSTFFMSPRRMLGSGQSRAVESGESSVRKALVDVQETDKDIVITVELPGVEKGDIQLNVTPDTLEMRVEKKEEQKEENDGYRAYSSRYAGFYRSVPLPAAVNPDQVKATYKNGVVEVTLLKKEPSTPQNVKVD